MSEDTKIPTWLYHKTEAPRLFDLLPGEGFPPGWKDSPAAFYGEPVKPAAAVAPVEATEADVGEIEPPASPVRRPGRKPMPRDENGKIIR